VSTPLAVCPGRSIVRAIHRFTCSSCRVVTVRARIGVWSGIIGHIWLCFLSSLVTASLGLGVGRSDFVKLHHGRLDQ
jgi:hypothetical protein